MFSVGVGCYTTVEHVRIKLHNDKEQNHEHNAKQCTITENNDNDNNDHGNNDKDNENNDNENNENVGQ